jgi:hypothetical protein
MRRKHKLTHPFAILWSPFVPVFIRLQSESIVTRIRSGVRVSAAAMHCSLPQVLQTAYGAHSASHSKRFSVPSPGVKRRVHDVDRINPCNAKVKNEWSYTSVPPYVPSCGSKRHVYPALQIRSFAVFIPDCVPVVVVLTSKLWQKYNK